MELSLIQIKKVTFGVNCIQKKDDGAYFFQRLTSEQLAYYSTMSDAILLRAESSAGCRLDFFTNSKKFECQTCSLGKYELLVNGLSVMLTNQPGCIAAELPGTSCRVTLMLPNHKPGGIKNIQLDDESYIKPYSYQHKFMFLGDSITQGSNSSRPSCSYVNRISNYFDAEVLNWGVGGTCFDEKTLIPPQYQPEIVFVAFGTNDYTNYASIGEIERHCKEYLDKVKLYFPQKQIICISPLWRADGNIALPTGTLDDVREKIISQIHAHEFMHIDGYTLVPHLTEYFEDGFLHPNDLGFSFFFANLARQISHIIEKQIL